MPLCCCRPRCQSNQRQAENTVCHGARSETQWQWHAWTCTVHTKKFVIKQRNRQKKNPKQKQSFWGRDDRVACFQGGPDVLLFISWAKDGQQLLWALLWLWEVLLAWPGHKHTPVSAIYRRTLILWKQITWPNSHWLETYTLSKKKKMVSVMRSQWETSEVSHCSVCSELSAI